MMLLRGSIDGVIAYDFIERYISGCPRWVSWSACLVCSVNCARYDLAIMRPLLIFLCVTVALAGNAQDPKAERPTDREEFEASLSFEAPPKGNMPGGWGGGPRETIFVDDKVVHSGRLSVRIERNAASPNDFSTITKSIPLDFSGATIELRGYLRTEDASGFVGLWLREDGYSPGLAFDNMQSRQLKGTTPWTEYSIKLPIDPEANRIFFGVLLAGTGKAWADDLQLLVDGKPVWDAPKVERPKTALDRDHEFDSGSGINITQLSSIQVEDLVKLGKIWGYLKYYHPDVTAGQYHWDYELLRILPKVLTAQDQAAANAILLRWIDSLATVKPCDPCAKLEQTNLHFGPDLDWIADTKGLGAELSRRLISIRDNPQSRPQFYVSLVPNIGNPKFEHELPYGNLKFPDSGFQLLSLYRLWNIVEYWSPYRNVLGEDWNSVLAEFIPRLATAKDAESYKQQLLLLIAQVHDGHANLWNALEVRPPEGKCRIPVMVRFIEGQPTIARLLADSQPTSGDLKAGDVVTELNGVAVSQLIEDWKPYYAASNDAALYLNLAQAMTRGECGESMIGVRRGNANLRARVGRVPITASAGESWHDLPGPTFRLLSKDVAYLKLSSVKAADCAHYVEQAAGTKGLIIDIRNYPSEFVVFDLGTHLVGKETPFVRFTFGELSAPGAFHWGAPMALDPKPPRYDGKIVVLVDEVSMSQAEYTTMAFRAAPGAIVVGSTSAGADGNVSPFALPGAISTGISGIGVFYPDKTPTQRIGIVPSVEVKPTLAGIRAGRDEVLEEALRQILGRDVPLTEIEKIAKP